VEGKDVLEYVMRSIDDVTTVAVQPSSLSYTTTNILGFSFLAVQPQGMLLYHVVYTSILTLYSFPRSLFTGVCFRNPRILRSSTAENVNAALYHLHSSASYFFPTGTGGCFYGIHRILSSSTAENVYGSQLRLCSLGPSSFSSPLPCRTLPLWLSSSSGSLQQLNCSKLCSWPGLPRVHSCSTATYSPASWYAPV
jgi:hypothetical protein